MVTPDQICEVVITAPDAGWLRDFTRKLVEERLAACGQNVTEIRSVYRWSGETYDDPEARVMLHTRRSLVTTIIEITRREHPYEVPCVFSTPIAEADPDYHAWVIEATAGADV